VALSFSPRITRQTRAAAAIAGRGKRPAEWPPALLNQLLVGLGLWLIFWLQAQRLFSDGPEMERESAWRKLYLYTAVFLGTVTVMASATTILAGILSRMLRAPTSGNVREPLAVLIVMGVVWAYHAAVLYSDSRQSAELPQQANIRYTQRGLPAACLGKRCRTPYRTRPFCLRPI
jgi:hypothetical protein